MWPTRTRIRAARDTALYIVIDMECGTPRRGRVRPRLPNQRLPKTGRTPLHRHRHGVRLGRCGHPLHLHRHGVRRSARPRWGAVYSAAGPSWAAVYTTAGLAQGVPSSTLLLTRSPSKMGCRLHCRRPIVGRHLYYRGARPRHSVVYNAADTEHAQGEVWSTPPSSPRQDVVCTAADMELTQGGAPSTSPPDSPKAGCHLHHH